MPTLYPIAETFHGIQGEGLFTGVPMTFIRFAGCSVGKTVCTFCDTDFTCGNAWTGGGELSLNDLVRAAEDTRRVCLTGGEPFDHDLLPFVACFHDAGVAVHIETSGTVEYSGLPAMVEKYAPYISVSPKPNWRRSVISYASEIKIIVPPPFPHEGWPTLGNALSWEREGEAVIFLQPRNLRNEISRENLRFVLDLLRRFPQFRLSVQLHKLLNLR